MYLVTGGEQSRDFTYIDNAVEANLLACQSGRVGRGEVINLACGASYSLNELVRLLNEIMDTSLNRFIPTPAPVM